LIENLYYLFDFLGLPFGLWVGIASYVCFLSAIVLAVLIKNRKINLDFKWHPRIATIGFILLTIYMIMILYMKGSVVY